MNNQHENSIRARLRVPTAIIMFGQTVEVSAEVAFYYNEGDNHYYFVDCKGYFGKEIVDLNFLTRHEDFGILVSSNKEHWNKDNEWWRTEFEEAKKSKEEYGYDVGNDDFDPDDGPRYA